MDRLESSPLPSLTPAINKGENLIFGIAVAIFWGLSACFLGSVLWGSQQNLSVRLRISLAILSFVFGLICFSASPANQGRMLRDLTRMLGASPKVEDLVQLQHNVGSAGFFNRIGRYSIDRGRPSVGV
jgi:ABC-type transport system involved in multi-copper enzyme maturation permease subunit